jgi:hypothetical protein
LWSSSFQVKKTFSNNTIQLSTLSNEDIALVNVNKLKAYRNPIVTVTAITVITKDKNKILPNAIPRRIIGRRMQIYEHFKFNKRKGEARYNKNYNGEIITIIRKKWIRDHKQQKSDTTTHYDTTIKPISRTRVISHNKPL